MRNLVIALVIFTAGTAVAQPSVGISKRAPIVGAGTVGDPLRLNPCPFGQAPVSTDATGLGTYACAAVGGGGVSDGDKGDVTVSGGGATWTIDNSVVTLAKMANVATNVILGRVTAGSGAPEALTPTQVTAMLNIATTSVKGLLPTLSNNATQYIDGTGAWSTPAGAGDVTDIVTTSPMAIGTTQGATCSSGSCTVALRAANTSRFFGRITAGAGNAEELTGTQATTLLDLATTSLKGLAPARSGSATTYLDGTGAYSTPAGSLTGAGTVNYLPRYATTTSFVNSAVSDDGAGVTIARPTALLGYFSATDEIGAFSGNTILLNGHIMFGNTTNATYRGYINKVGYLESTSQFRDLEVDDGKGSKIFDVVGSTKAFSLVGPATLNGDVTLGDASADTITITGTPTFNADIKTADNVKIATKSGGSVSLSAGCGTGATFTGDRSWGTVTTATTGLGTCVITFGTAFTNTPTCITSADSTTKGYSQAEATGSLTLGTLVVTKYHWNCVDHY